MLGHFGGHRNSSAATALGVFFVPVLFVLVERIAKRSLCVAVAPAPVLEEGTRLMRVESERLSASVAFFNGLQRGPQVLRRPAIKPPTDFVCRATNNCELRGQIWPGGTCSRILFYKGLIREALKNNYDLANSIGP